MAPHSVAVANLAGLVSMAKMREAPAFLAACVFTQMWGLRCHRAGSVTADCGGDAGAGAGGWFTEADSEIGIAVGRWNRDIRGGLCSPAGSGRTKGGQGGRVGPRGVGPGGGSHLDDSQADGAPARAEGKAASWQQ